MGLVSTLFSAQLHSPACFGFFIGANFTDTLIPVNPAYVDTGPRDAIISTDGWCGSRSRADHYESVPIIKRIANAAKRES